MKAAIATRIATNIIIIVASAFISGLRPNLILEKIKIGNVVDPGPVTKLAITKSSSDRQNAKSHPEKRPGARRGRVIALITLKGFAPKSAAASSKETPIPVNLA